jgi:dihydrodipicolinate reductase
MYKRTHIWFTIADFWRKMLQLCVWSIDGWEKKKSRYIQAPANRSGTLVGDTRVQFHNDQQHLLVVHESQLAIYDGNLECLRSVSPLKRSLI